MKTKIIQILLGAVGSVIAAIAAHLAQLPSEAATTASLAAGPLTTAVLGGLVSGFTQQSAG